MTVTAVDCYRTVVDVNLFYFIPHLINTDQQKCLEVTLQMKLLKQK